MARNAGNIPWIKQEGKVRNFDVFLFFILVPWLTIAKIPLPTFIYISDFCYATTILTSEFGVPVA